MADLIATIHFFCLFFLKNVMGFLRLLTGYLEESNIVWNDLLYGGLFYDRKMLM